MNEFEKNGFATFIDNGDGWERIPNAKFMIKDEDGTEIEMTPNEVIKQLMQDNKSLEHYINNLQSKINKINLFKLYLQERLLKHKDEIERGINEFDERNECEDILNEFINFFKE